MVKIIRKIKALVNKTFVTDCPVCHKHFYGHYEYGVQQKIDGIHYRIVCHKCFKKVKNEK